MYISFAYPVPIFFPFSVSWNLKDELKYFVVFADLQFEIFLFTTGISKEKP